MWADILVSITISIGEALFDNLFGLMNINKNKKILEKICKKLLEKFVDSSLDNDDFYNFVRSDKFISYLRTYYFVLQNNGQDTDIVDKMYGLTKNRCPKANSIELRQFFKDIDDIFSEIINKVLMTDQQSFGIMCTIIRANRIIVSKICESEENLIRYLDNNNSILKFEDKLIDMYHKNCIIDYGVMNFTGIAGAEKKNTCKLEQLYVKNNFFIYSREKHEMFGVESPKNKDNSLIDFKNFFKYSNRIVILGGAGFGKSTCLNYLFCNYEKEFNTNALKLKLNLKDHANSIIEKGVEILDCLCQEFERRIPHHLLKSYDVKSALSKHLFEGNCLVIFDALDEVDSQFARDKIRDEIANFCNVYFLNRYIITSREVGYLKNKFDDSFLHLRICLFTDNQIRSYTFKWFKLNIPNKQDSGNKLSTFMSEVEKAKCLDLIRNPIILVLALIVFNSEHNLPHKRVEFYKKCIDTFLIEREKRKEAFDMKGIECICGDNLILPRVSYYKFEKSIENKDYKLTNEELKLLIYKALEVTDKINWIDPINKFINYLVERTELIRLIDEDKFDFAHKTFSEFFLAVYFTKCVDIDILLGKLDDWIGDSNYDELANLIIEVVIEENVNIQHNMLLNYLFDSFFKYAILGYRLKDNKRESLGIDIAHDYLGILSKLFLSNSLLPKFIEKYHSLLLDYPECFGNRSRIAINGRSYIGFDKDLLFKMYIRKYENNDHFAHAARLLYYCHFVFNEMKNQITNDIHKRSLDLIAGIGRKLKRKNQLSEEDIQDIYRYFCDEEFDIVKRSEVIFYHLLYLLLTNINIKNSIQLVDKLCLFQIEINNVFTSIFAPPQYFILLMHSRKNSSFFALTIMSIIFGNKNKINWLIDYSKDISNYKFGTRTYIENEKNSEINFEDFYNVIVSSSNILYDIISNNNDYYQLIEKIYKAGLFNKKYEHIYKKAYEIICEENITDQINKEEEIIVK